MRSSIFRKNGAGFLSRLSCTELLIIWLAQILTPFLPSPSPATSERARERARANEREATTIFRAAITVGTKLATREAMTRLPPDAKKQRKRRLGRWGLESPPSFSSLPPWMGLGRQGSDHGPTELNRGRKFGGLGLLLRQGQDMVFMELAVNRAGANIFCHSTIREGTRGTISDDSCYPESDLLRAPSPIETLMGKGLEQMEQSAPYHYFYSRD
ncbi:hypothetical protein Cgig2_003103 [Carnegiea gigantea]|uniref:Uncharacterized protein n=1 Tax=Carnegiea gigantea TaxID=171969 RepID=A0A9Q1GHA2_9CARY|nr:hypothetical protein Cgig2_003103 [Carnegiea gigantea]